MQRLGRRRLPHMVGGRRPSGKGGGYTGCAASISFPACDPVLRDTIVPQAHKALGIELGIEIVNGNDRQSRTAAAIAARGGPGIILAIHNWPRLYAGDVAEVDAARGDRPRSGGDRRQQPGLPVGGDRLEQ